MTIKKTIYFVRHGQSEDNARPVFQAYDSPLSEKGLQQADKIAERAKHLQFDRIICSPQMRAKQTAEAIQAKTGKDLVASELFIERFKPTSIDGKPWEDETAAAVYKAWEKSLLTPGLRVEDGENYDDSVARADQALKYLEKHDAKNIIVVSHGHFIRTIVARVMLGSDLTPDILQRFYELTSLENTAITVLQLQDAHGEEFRWRLWTLNDHAHFAE